MDLDSGVDHGCPGAHASAMSAPSRKEAVATSKGQGCQRGREAGTALVRQALRERPEHSWRELAGSQRRPKLGRNLRSVRDRVGNRLTVIRQPSRCAQRSVLIRQYRTQGWLEHSDKNRLKFALVIPLRGLRQTSRFLFSATVIPSSRASCSLAPGTPE